MKKKLLSQNEYDLLRDALRRYTRFCSGEKLLKAWTGLGSLSDFKSVYERGLMIPDGLVRKGYPGWWKVTELGAQILIDWMVQGYDYENLNPPIPSMFYDSDTGKYTKYSH